MGSGSSASVDDSKAKTGAKKEEPKKEEPKKVEAPVEEEVDMGAGGLFGDDDYWNTL